MVEQRERFPSLVPAVVREVELLLEVRAVRALRAVPGVPAAQVMPAALLGRI